MNAGEFYDQIASYFTWSAQLHGCNTGSFPFLILWITLQQFFCIYIWKKWFGFVWSQMGQRRGRGGIPVWVANWLQPASCRACAAAAEGPHGKQCVGLRGAFQHILQESGKEVKKREERKRGEKENIAAKSTWNSSTIHGETSHWHWRKAALSLHHDSVYTHTNTYFALNVWGDSIKWEKHI